MDTHTTLMNSSLVLVRAGLLDHLASRIDISISNVWITWILYLFYIWGFAFCVLHLSIGEGFTFLQTDDLIFKAYFRYQHSKVTYSDGQANVVVGSTSQVISKM